MSEALKLPTVVGTAPRLPRVLARFPWWTRPVRAEYLAVVRIGIALTLLYDQLRQYLPCLHVLYGRESTGATELWRPSAGASTWGWSLFLGFEQSSAHTLALAALSVLSVWLAFRLVTSAPTATEEPSDDFRTLLIWWLSAALIAMLGIWAGTPDSGQDRSVGWLLPLVLLGCAGAFLTLRWFRFHRADRSFVVACIGMTALLLVGAALASSETLQQAFYDAFTGWSDNSELMRVAFCTWVGFATLLGLGLFTRVSAVMTWILTVSFTYLNPLPNSGECNVRNIILFYVILAPCGAAWSLDRWLWRRAASGPVYVHPWPLRLLLIQLVVIYGFTGLYKTFTDLWLSGDALYYTLADLYYSRMSLDQLDLPLELLRWMTWIILVWEVTFPLWILLPWTRSAILISGVVFHIGTYALLELGGFEWYMFVLYLPLLPWARWLRDPGYPDVHAAAPSNPGSPHYAPSVRQRILGWLVAWQLVFLAAANGASLVLEVVPFASDDSTGLTLATKAKSVTDFWAEATHQMQNWQMYQSIPTIAKLPYFEVRYVAEEAASHTVWQTQVLPSEQEPDNLHRYFRFGRTRCQNIEDYVLPDLSEKAETIEETNEIWAREISEFVYQHQILIRNYIACRVHHARAGHHDAPEPQLVILYLRRYRTNPPGSPAIWESLGDVPVARWVPGLEEAGQALHAYNPVTRRFEPLTGE